ncbi:MAG: glycoside hydrolase family 97 N-terminal domain-containing protein, partial [Muribaculaceae bacterium]|nr:glycoside hydrolase family 97 N-terminal domain-containing protein [Muribaculaceae bacterium]
MRHILCTLLIGASIAATAETITVNSPDGRTAVTLSDKGGNLTYSLQRDGQDYLMESPLGLYNNTAEMVNGLHLVSSDTTSVNRRYTQTRIKHAGGDYNARRLVAKAVNAAGDTLGVEFSVADNDVAFRYLVPRLKGGETGAML